ncbi:MAG: hypothetical protein DMF89_21420 [Acidobacteria bacterium]|nr:MAG: hypothetical protein DMF89_21420 [Acidobacteriota bacterium]
MANKTLPAAVALFCAWLFADAPLLAAPSPVRSYVWSGELVGINRDARLAILKAEFREHVLRYIDQFTPGDRVILTWATSREGETDDIIYVGHYDKSSTSNYGYVLPVEVVAVNKTDRTITFRIPVPPKALRTLKLSQTGDRVKVTAPFDQPSETASIISVDRSEAQSRQPPKPSTVTRN